MKVVLFVCFLFDLREIVSKKGVSVLKKKYFLTIIIAFVCIISLLGESVAYAIGNGSIVVSDDVVLKKIEPYLLENLDSFDGDIPVWLWMEDIDHEEVAQRVYERTGLCENNLAVVNEQLSAELATDIADFEEVDSEKQLEIKEEFQEYINKTKTSRKIEAECVNRFLRELRTVQEEMLTEKNRAIFNTLNLHEESLILTDTQAPVYIVYVSKEDINRLAKNPKVTGIYYYDMNDFFEPEGNTIPEVMAASSVNTVHNNIGLSGSGVNVGVIDEGKVEPCNEIDSSRITYVTPSSNNFSAHSTNVARIAAGTEGVAPTANIYSASVFNDYSVIAAISNMSTAGVQVANFSMGRYRGLKEYTVFEIYIDYIVRNKRFSFVTAAGNNHGTITEPGLAYNIITAGGFFNQGTTDKSDDVMYEFSNYNHLNGCVKPDFVADQSYVGGTGTSYAAPFVTGTIALLYELRPTLVIQPEAVKAILMASCHRKVTPSSGDPVENIYDGITNHQGAGAIDPYKAIAIAGSGDYGVRYLQSTAIYDTIRFSQPQYGATGLNVCLAWSVENISSTQAGDPIDLNLCLDQGDIVAGSSQYENSSTESVYVVPSSQSEYAIQVERFTPTGSTIRYAYAFSVSRNRYQYTEPFEGAYYLKNKATGRYLNLTANGDTSTITFSGSPEQKWLLTDGKISTMSLAGHELSIGATLSGNYKKASVTTSGTDVTLISNTTTESDATGTITFYNLTTNYALGAYNSLGAWHPYSASNESQQWYLESVAYQKGDVNLNGSISTSDALAVLQYSNQSVTPTNIQAYFADVNGDDIISSVDALMIMQIANGILD